MSKVKPVSSTLSTNGAAHGEPKAAVRQPAYFMSLSLENVRCFGPKQTLDLSDGNGKPAPWTIILGLNGTGKTTILQLLSGFEHYPASPAPQTMEQIENEGVDSRFDLIPIWTFTRRKGRDAKCEALVGLAPSMKVQVHEVVEWSVSILSYREQEFGGMVYGPVGAPAPPWCCAYGAGRRVGSISLSETASEQDPTESLFSDKAELRNPEEWLLRLDYASTKDTSDSPLQKRRLAQIKNLILSIMPDNEVSDIRLSTTLGPDPVARAEFKTPYGWVPLRQLGYGYQTLITWVADLAYRMAERYPDSKNPLAEPAVVLVDEIDLHLHPVWQRKLMGFLTERFPNTQFIATAHSPLVAQAAADANLAVLRREGDHVVIDQELGNIRNWRIDQILTSELFGLETARPPHIEPLLAERAKLLAKAKRTAKDENRIRELEAEIGELPFGETPEEREDRKEIRKTLDLLMKERKHAK
jgi:hypothetical protein